MTCIIFELGVWGYLLGRCHVTHWASGPWVFTGVSGFCIICSMGNWEIFSTLSTMGNYLLNASAYSVMMEMLVATMGDSHPALRTQHRLGIVLKNTGPGK